MPSSVDMDFSVGQATHKGLVRENNEDSFGWFSLPNGELFIVADGMGGYAGGAEASKRTVISFKEYFESHEGTPAKLLEEALLYADSKVQEIGTDNPSLNSCGSTIVALFVSGSTGYFIHAGDSRLYLFGKGKLRQIGRDHSAVQDMLMAGVISKEEAEKSPKNVITQSLGGNIDISRCIVEQFTILSGCTFLLCSDGLWGSVPEYKINAVLSQSVPSSSKANMMIKAAIDAGGPDNITAQVIEFGETGSQAQQFPKRKGRSGMLAIVSLALLLLFVTVGYYVYRTKLAAPSPKPEINPISKSEEHLAKPSAVEVKSYLEADEKNKPKKSDTAEEPSNVQESSPVSEKDKY